MNKALSVLLKILAKPQIQNKIISLLNTKAVEYFTANLFKLSGFKSWIITLLIHRVIEEGDEHLIEPAFRKIGYAGDYLEGARIYKKVKDANDVDEWLDSLNDV